MCWPTRPPLVADCHYDVPLEALARLGDDYRMLHYGAFNAGDEQILVEAGVADRCHLLGHIPYEEYPTYLSVCDVGLCWLPQVRGNFRVAFPNRIGDFLSAGLPIVTSAAVEVADFVRDTGAGSVMPSDDSAGMCAAIEDVFQRRSEISSAVQEARRQSTWEVEMAELVRRTEHVQRVLIVTGKQAAYQNRTLKIARELADHGKEVYYISRDPLSSGIPGVHVVKYA